jgi:hypothetical protein
VAGHNVGLKLDHVIVWGDVDRVGAEVSQALGLEPVDGGVHPGIGTRNALFAMDGNRFLEVLGPDGAQEARAWGPGDDHPDGALWWWVARTRSSLHDVRQRLAELGVASGPIERGSRIRPDGERLEWETVDPPPEPYGTALPFVIRWKEGPPLRGLTDVCELRELRLRHPDVPGLHAVLDGLGLGAFEVERAGTPGFSVVITGPAGAVELTTP